MYYYKKIKYLGLDDWVLVLFTSYLEHGKQTAGQYLAHSNFFFISMIYPMHKISYPVFDLQMTQLFYFQIQMLSWK